MDASSKLYNAIEGVRSQLLDILNNELDDLDESLRMTKQALRHISSLIHVDADSAALIAKEVLEKLESDDG